MAPVEGIDGEMDERYVSRVTELIEELVGGIWFPGATVKDLVLYTALFMAQATCSFHGLVRPGLCGGVERGTRTICA